MKKYRLLLKLGIMASCQFIFYHHGLKAQFIEVSEDVGINYVCKDPTQLSGGVAFFDFNNDGFEDVYIIGGSSPDRLYENQGDGTFQDISKIVGIDAIDLASTMGVTCGDLDNDGYIDLFITTKNNDRCYLLWNNGGTFFNEGGVEAGITEQFYGSSIALGDYNIDGNLDLYIGNYNSGIPGDFLFKNNGNRTFTNESHLLGDANEGTALAVAFSDIDLDHDIDILLGNDFGDLYLPNRLFVNQFPSNSFIEISEQAAWDIKINSMGIAIGDYDEDGDLDYYVSDMNDNHLFVNQNNNSFIEKALEAGIDDANDVSWGNAFFDYNNDTYLDLYVSNGVFEIDPTAQQNRLFKGNGSIFSDVSEEQKVASTFRSRGLAIGDYNNDGQLDILVGVVQNEITQSSHTLLYQNPGNGLSNWVKINLDGTASNKDGYGSLVRVVSAGRSFIRELSGGASYLSHSSNVIHFGLGNASIIDSMIVIWPNGNEQMFTDLEVNQTYCIVEDKEIFKTLSVYKEILQDEEVFLEGAFRKEAGIYTDTLVAGSAMREIITTKLIINETVVQVITNVTDANMTEQNIKIWPNPFDDHFNVKIPDEFDYLTDCDINIIDMSGREVFKKKIEMKEGSIADSNNLIYLPVRQANLQRGVYFLQLNYNGKVYSHKIIKK